MKKPVSFLFPSSLLGEYGRQHGFGSLPELVRLALCDCGVDFTSFDIKFSKDGMVVKLWDATQNGTGAKKKYLIQNPPGCSGRVYVPKELLCECIRGKILASQFFRKVILKKPIAIPPENFLEYLKTFLKGSVYEVEVVNETTVTIYFPSGKLDEKFKGPDNKFRTLMVSDLRVCDGKIASIVGYDYERFQIPEGMTIEEMMEMYQKVFPSKEFQVESYSSGGETRYLIFTMGLDPGYSGFDIFHFVRKYPIIECYGCCKEYIWKKQVTTCCGGHSKFCIPCINQSIQSALDNTSAAQLSVRCPFGEGCDKALIDFSDGKVVILSGFKPVLNKDTNSKINAVGLRLKETGDDSLKEARRAEALANLESLRKEAEEADPNSDIPENTNFCPKCFASIVRTSGCNAMICSACGTPLCIKCGTFDTTTQRCQCTPSITFAYFDHRLPKGLLTTRFEIREDPPSQS